jgi:hypothetical protein
MGVSSLQNLVEQSELLAILILVGLFSTISILIVWRLKNPKKNSYFHDLNGLAAPIFSIPAVLFSLTIALMASSIWENYTIATKAIRSESQAIMNIMSLTSTTPTLKNSNLIDLSKQYAQSIVDDEWHTLSNNKTYSIKTQLLFENLRTHVFEVVNGLENRAESRALFNAFQTISTARETRLAFVSFDVHPIRWYGILILGILIQVAVGLAHIGKPKALICAILITTTTLFVPLCIISLTLNSPYQGLIAISDRPYLQIFK